MSDNAPPSLALHRAVMLAWRKQCYRSSATARTFGARLRLIPGTEDKKPIVKPLFYLVNTFRTLALLRRDRPRIIFCLNLPAILPLVCALYGVFARADVVMDFHSGGLSAKKWRIFIPVYKWIAARAPFAICHNRHDGAVIAGWGGRVVHLLTLPQAEFPGHAHAPRTGKPLFLFSCSFANDEPVELALEAMRKCPEYDFLVSGDYRKQGLDPSAMPPNVRLGGFLAYRDYLARMAEAAAVLSLSTRPHTMQMAVHEAITMGVPVVTNDAPVLREVLGDGGVFCTLDVDSLACALRTAATGTDTLVSGVGQAKSRAYRRIDAELEQVRIQFPELLKDNA